MKTETAKPTIETGIPFVCSTCSKKVLTEKGHLPSGWKRREAEVICSDCWRDSFFTLSITMAVSGPLEKKDWPAFREMLNINWAQATSLCNWAVTELAKADVIRQPDKKKLPKADLPYLYPEARKLFPGLAGPTVYVSSIPWKRSIAKPDTSASGLEPASLQTCQLTGANSRARCQF